MIKYEFMGLDSKDPGGEKGKTGFRESAPFRNFSTGNSMGDAPMAIPVEKFLNRPFPGTKLDVPRLAAPRGPARGRARRTGRVGRTVCLCTIAARTSRSRPH